MRPWLVLALLAGLLASGCLQTPEEPQGAREDAGAVPEGEPTAKGARTLDRGSQSGIKEFRTVVVTRATEHVKLWQMHSQETSPETSPPPLVDFDRETVAGVFLGTRPNACHGIEFLGAAESPANGTTVVRWRAVTPGEGQVCAQVITHPFFLVAIPEADASVTFQQEATVTGDEIQQTGPPPGMNFTG